MRLSITLALATAVAVSAQNCNPTYNVASSGECFTNCNIKTGQKYLSGWTMDHTSPLFIDSLNLMCTKGTAEYLAFMSEAGICMSRCPDNPALFADEFAGACAWYAQHKNDTCTDSPNTTNTTIASSSTTNSSPSNSSDIKPTISSDVKVSNNNSTSAANKLQFSTFAVALIAGASYLTL